MKAKVGLWIDHTKASIVAVTDRGEVTTSILSKVERRIGPTPGVRSRTRTADDSRKRRFEGHLNTYYDAVIACIGDAQSILILGPGEAKGELVKRLKRDKLGGRIVGTETIGKMTDRQLALKTRERFEKKGSPWSRSKGTRELLQR